jgi:uncharacterized protein (DUF1800 family)
MKNNKATSYSAKLLPAHSLISKASLLLGVFALLSACVSPSSPEANAVHKSSAFLQAQTTYATSQVQPDLLLNRISFGATPSSSAQMQQLGMDAYLLQQLTPRSVQMPAPIQAQIDAMTISKKSFVELMQDLETQRKAAYEVKGVDDTLRHAYQQELARLSREAAARKVLRATYSNQQLLEEMDWFWSNHFSIFGQKGNLRAMVGDFNESAIRPHALGNFRDLLRATILHPAMMRYLDNEHNAVGKINENYARELLELHTMGVGSGYTQADIQELARVLTGFGVTQRTDVPKMRPEFVKQYVRQGLFEFHPARHDFGEKKILGKTIAGQGFAEIEAVLDLLMAQPATAHFISQKLAQHFVADQPDSALVERMAQNFMKTKGDIPALLQTMFNSPQFIASLGQKFKDPTHFVIGAVRASYDGQLIKNPAPMLNWLNQLGQFPYGRITPDGYSMQESAWASPAQMTQRFDIAKNIGRGAPNLFKVDTPTVVPNAMTGAMMNSMSENTNAMVAVKNDTQMKDMPKKDTQEIPRPNLAQAAYFKQWASRFAGNTIAALNQAENPLEWNVFFLASPEMMRR